MNQIKIIFFYFIILVFVSPLFAETIVLKSGRSLEGKLINKNDQYVQLDSKGKLLTIFLEDIKKIEETTPQSLKMQERKKEEIKQGIEKIGFLYKQMIDKRADYAYEGQKLTDKGEFVKVVDNLNEEIRMIHQTALKIRLLSVPSECRKLKDEAVNAAEAQIQSIETMREVISRSLITGAEPEMPEEINKKLKAQVNLAEKAVAEYASEKDNLMYLYQINKAELSMGSN